MESRIGRIALCLSLAAVSALAGACGGIRVVNRTPNGGVIAYVGSPEKAQEKAQEYMHQQCPQGFDVIEEGEAVVGTETEARTDSRPTRYGESSRTNASTTDKREWRVTYACKTAPGKQGKVEQVVVVY